MTEPASVSADERLRLFLALRLPDDVLEEIERWQRTHLRNVRVVPREHLHVTLAFLGHRPAGELAAHVGAVRDVAAGAGEIRLTPVRYSETRGVGMLVLEDEGGRAALLAAVARWRERPRLRPEPPPRRTFVPSDAAAFLSQLQPGGAVYRVLESVALGANVGGE